MCCADLYDSAFGMCGFICHQKPARSFSICGIQFLLCARCTGIWGLFIAAFMYGWLSAVKTSYLKLSLMLCAALIVNASTLIGMFDANIPRFILGSMIGTASGLVISKSLHHLTRSNV